MQVRFDSEFGPDALLGSGSTGLILIDDSGTVSMFNRQAAKLLGIGPELAIGSPLSNLLSDAGLDSWLDSGPQKQPRLSLQIGGRPLDLAMSSADLDDRKYRIVSIRDATKRQALEAKARDYERGVGGTHIDWNARLKASSILQLLRAFADEPGRRDDVWDMAKRTGSVIFPYGGAVCTQGTGQFTVKASWGRMSQISAFPDGGCMATQATPSTECSHFSVGVPGVCFVVESGRVILAREPGVDPDIETESLFVETLDFALSNANS